MGENFIHKNTCRVCKNSNFLKILDLGEMPLANSFIAKEDLNNPEPKFPLAVYYCKNCGLLQLLEIVNPEVLFRHYYYLTSTSKPLAEHFVKFGRDLADRFIKSKDDLVIDIGGNDAVLLNTIKNRCRVLNIEPAKNVAKISKGKGVETIENFFSAKLAAKILKKYSLAKVITASNVIAHIDNLDDIFKGIKLLIGNQGVFVMEVHWVGNLLGLEGIGGFDQIYHEHLSYFSLTALKKLVVKFSLKIFDVKLIPIHGKSLQVYIGKNYQPLKAVDDLLEKEKILGLDKIETYLNFAAKVEENKNKLKNLLLELKKNNKKIVGYGAAAKGNTLINYFQIDRNFLDFIVDDSPIKQGLYTPGTHILVSPAERLKKDKIDYLLLLAWNYADAILKKEQELRKKGAKFIIPLPEVKIV